MKRHILSVILALAMIFPLLSDTVLAASTVANGRCGDHLTWTLYNNGTLVIDGTGPMNDFLTGAEIPWGYWRSTIRTIEVRNGVTRIGINAFYNSDNLTSISLPESLTIIGEDGLSYCDNLSSITLPDNLTHIDAYAFSHCYNLKSISLPACVETIGAFAFAGCTALSAIHVDEENAYFSSIDGVLFNKEQTALLAYPNSKGSVYVIPDHVTTIADNAFYACESLTKVTMPDHLTTVGTEAFANCVELTSMTFPASIESIGEYAFDGCLSLESVSFLGTPTSIDNYAFGSCDNLSKIAFFGSAPNIAKYAFRYAKATVSYPADDPTWADKAGQKYGSKELVWTPYSCQENGHPFSVATPAEDPSCEFTGLTEGSHCGFCGEVIMSQEIIPATGHTYGDPIFTWADDLSSATLTLTCHCEEAITEDCQLIWDDSQPATLTVTAICTVEEETFSEDRQIIAVMADDMVTISLPQAIPGLTVLVCSYSETDQMISCNSAASAEDDPLSLRATISGSNVKLFFLNEENAPLLPALSF